MLREDITVEVGTGLKLWPKASLDLLDFSLTTV